MEEKQKFYNKLKNRYRLIIYNDTTFQSVWNMKLSRLKVFTIASLVSAIIVILVILLIATTGLREYIPGYPKSDYRKMLVRNTLLADSLEIELEKRDLFFKDIQAIMKGEVPQRKTTAVAESTSKVEFHEYNHDSIFHDELLAEQLNLSLKPANEKNTGLSQMHFFVPLKGIVTEHFKSTPNHLGTDIVSKSNARIFSVLDGTVIFAGWTLNTGYVMYIQHAGNLISGYKHNAELLKKEGDEVKAGEVIAIIGNTGEYTNGPHLHFELWHNGKPLDAEKYIDF